MEFPSRLGATLASVVKIALKSREASAPEPEPAGAEMVILGNGPSLADTMDRRSDWLATKELMAVNFAANTFAWEKLKPRWYVLADPHFWNKNPDENLQRLWKNLGATPWPVILYVPCDKVKATRRLLGDSQVRVKGFNMTPVEGFRWFRHGAWRRGWGMPRPRNVLIPAIMIALREGFSKVMLAGADHTWTRTLSVDDQNRVVTVQPHFYEDNREEHARVASVYRDVHLHNVLESLTIAFRSYHQIAEYARKRGVDVINITPGSFIDAFPRRQL